MGEGASGTVVPLSPKPSPGATAVQRCFPVQDNQSAKVTGSGTIDVAPKAMVVSASIANGGSVSSLDVSVRLNDQDHGVADRVEHHGAKSP